MVSAVEASGAGGFAALALAFFGVAVLEDSGAACVDAPSTFDFWADASPMGADPDAPEERFYTDGIW